MSESKPPFPAPAASLSDIGGTVRACRKASGLRIDDAAALCGVSVDLLSRLENGGGVSSLRLLRVLDGLGLALAILPKSPRSPTSAR